MGNLFHGACIGCKKQKISSRIVCEGCANMDADWTLPDLFEKQKKDEKDFSLIAFLKEKYLY